MIDSRDLEGVTREYGNGGLEEDSGDKLEGTLCNTLEDSED